MALAWGLGLGAFGFAMAAASRSLADAFATSPDLARTVRSVFPGFDLTSAGGFLQLLVQLLFVVAGFAAVTLVSGWATDETSGRLELVLAAPLSRRAWVLRSGLGVFAAIALLTAIVALGVGAGAALAGSDALTPMAGTLALGLYAAALAGVGLAVGGLAGTGVAAATVAVVVVATYLIDLLAPALDLPGWVHKLEAGPDRASGPADGRHLGRRRRRGLPGAGRGRAAPGRRGPGRPGRARLTAGPAGRPVSRSCPG
jgi:ABC-2 type transport system permease protein